MFTTTKRLFLLSTILIINSCDIPGLLQVSNHTNNNIIFWVHYNNNEPKRLNISVEEETKYLIFGFGQFWTDDRIEEYVQQVSKIEIISKSDTLVLEDKIKLFQFLKKRRKGVFKSRIKIKVE